MEIFWGMSVIQNITRDICIEHCYPLSEIKTEIKRFEAFVNKIPFKWVKRILKIQKHSYPWNILRYSEMHSAYY